MRRWVAFIGLIGVLLGACSPHKAPGPLEVTLWYWHTPYAVTPDQQAFLSQLAVRRMFVRAGTLSEREGHMSMVMPQAFESGATDITLVLVFNLDYVFVRGFDDVDVQVASGTLLKSFAAQTARAQNAGFKVEGLQIDFDCPTSRLEKYGALLTSLKSGLVKGQSLSITALPTWLSSGDFEKILEPLDFYVPQFYEGSLGSDYGHMAPISNIEKLREGLAQCSRINKPFLAGLPAYGQVLLYDAQGQMSGTYRDLSPLQASRHPALSLDLAYGVDSKMDPATLKTWSGVELLSFVATKTDSKGRGLGYRIVYKIPTATMLQKCYQAVVEDRPANCLGVAIFRYPEEGETMTVGLPTISAVILGQPLKSNLELSVKANPSPWELVEQPRTPGKLPAVITLELKCSGNEGTFVGPRAIQLEVNLDKPGVEASAGEFDGVFARTADGQRTTMANASRLVFTGSWLSPGQSLKTGPIRIGPNGANSLEIKYAWLSSGGFEQRHGELSVKSLADLLHNSAETQSHAH